MSQFKALFCHGLHPFLFLFVRLFHAQHLPFKCVLKIGVNTVYHLINSCPLPRALD